MSYIQHDAVLVTIPAHTLYPTSMSRQEGCPDVAARVEEFRAALPAGWGPLLVGPVPAPVNGYVHYVLLPDGSGASFADSDLGDDIRERFRAIFDWTWEDGSTPFDVVSLTYGGDYAMEQPPRAVDTRLR